MVPDLHDSGLGNLELRPTCYSRSLQANWANLIIDENGSLSKIVCKLLYARCLSGYNISCCVGSCLNLRQQVIIDFLFVSIRFADNCKLLEPTSQLRGVFTNFTRAITPKDDLFKLQSELSSPSPVLWRLFKVSFGTSERVKAFTVLYKVVNKCLSRTILCALAEEQEEFSSQHVKDCASQHEQVISLSHFIGTICQVKVKIFVQGI